MESRAELQMPGGSPVIRRPANIIFGVRVPVYLTHYCSPTSVFLRFKRPGMSDDEGRDDFCISPSNHRVRDAFIGMHCLVRQDSSRTLALRARVTDVYRDPSGAPFKVAVLYVDSGRADAVGFGCLYSIDADTAAEPQKAIACYIRCVEPTSASSCFDLKQLWKRRTSFEAIFYTASDGGIYEVDLHAKCREQNARLKTYDVGKFLVQKGFAKHVGNLVDTPNSVEKCGQGDVGVNHNSSEGKQSATPEQSTSSVISTCPEPTGDVPLLRGTESSAVPKHIPLKILVTFVLSPDAFYGQDVSRVEERSLVENLLLQSTKEIFSATEVKTGAYYIHRELPQQPCGRVRVEDIEESGMCHVFFIDYGHRKTVNFSSLCLAHPRLSTIPPLAMKLRLSGIHPQKKWSEAAVTRFKELAHTGIPLTAALAGADSSHDELGDKVHAVELSSPRYGDVAECMIREGHAKALGRSAAMRVPNFARPVEPTREDRNFPLRSRCVNTGESREAASNFGMRRDRRASRLYTPQGRQGNRSTRTHILRGQAQLTELVMDPVKPLRPPQVGSCVLGQVSAVLSPSCFYLVFPYGRRSIDRLRVEGVGRKSRETLDSLMRDLQDACNKESLRENWRVVKAQGEMVAAKSNLDGCWYRARVVAIDDGDRIKVFFVDFGFCEAVSVEHVRSLEKRFTHLPQQALQACLVADKDKNALGSESIWNDLHSDVFVNCVSGKDLLVKIVYVAHGLLHVRLFFMDNGDKLRSVYRCLRNALKSEPH